MSKQYEVVPENEIVLPMPMEWLCAYHPKQYIYLRPVSLPVQDGVIKGAWEDGWQAAFDAVKQGWQSCSIGHDLPQTLLKNFLSKQPIPTVTTQEEGKHRSVPIKNKYSFGEAMADSREDITPASLPEAGGPVWDEAFTNVPVRVSPVTEKWLQQHYDITKKIAL